MGKGEKPKREGSNSIRTHALISVKLNQTKMSFSSNGVEQIN